MKLIKEVGIEKEYFLTTLTDQLVEPAEYGFPYDEMGFLVELRSVPSTQASTIYMSLLQEKTHQQARARRFDLSLDENHTVYYDADWVDAVAKKYKVHDFIDFTQNIYGKKESHHLGIFDIGPGKKLTAGMHVHFSCRKHDGTVIELPIEEIVKEMDKRFETEVKSSQRILGEWEPKDHGFEYRSLPNTANSYIVTKTALEVLENATHRY